MRKERGKEGEEEEEKEKGKEEEVRKAGTMWEKERESERETRQFFINLLTKYSHALMIKRCGNR